MSRKEHGEAEARMAYSPLVHDRLRSDCDQLWRVACARQELGVLISFTHAAFVDQLMTFETEVKLQRRQFEEQLKGTPAMTPYESLLFAMLLLESTPFFFLLRIGVDLCEGLPFAPIPVRAKERREVGDAIVISKRKFYLSIVKDLRRLGCNYLADVFEAVYCEAGWYIRNAIAHGTYRYEPRELNPFAFPDPRVPKEPWRFGRLTLDGNRWDVSWLGVSDEDWRQLLKNMLIIRVQVVQSWRAIEKELKSRPRIVKGVLSGHESEICVKIGLGGRMSIEGDLPFFHFPRSC